MWCASAPIRRAVMSFETDRPRSQTMPEITCLRCKQPIDSQLEACPHCAEPVTNFQRTYSARLIHGKYQIPPRLGVARMGEIFNVPHIHLKQLPFLQTISPHPPPPHPPPPLHL